MASKHEAIFGELRSALQQPPSPQAWAQLCAQLDKCTLDAHFEDAITPYLLDALKAWPDDPLLRVAPHTWALPALKQKPTPLLRFATGVNLSGCRCGPAALTKLLATDALDAKTSLRLSRNGLKDQGAIALTKSPKLAALRVLILSQCRIGDEGAQAIAKCKHFKQLETLDLSDNFIMQPGVDALSRSKHLAAPIRAIAPSWLCQEPPTLWGDEGY